MRLSAVLRVARDLPHTRRAALEVRLVMFPPNDRQWDAVSETEQHLLVVSGAGTGKTHTVVWKILYLLGVEVRGQRITTPLGLRDLAAITFTNQAAKDLKEDLRSALRAHGRAEEAHEIEQARIGTIHGFCADLLRDYALRLGHPPLRKVFEEGEAAALAVQVARDALVEALETGAVPGLDELLGVWRTTDVDGWVVQLLGHPDLVRRLLARPGDSGDRERALLALAALAKRRLDGHLIREGAVDFDRMVHNTRDLLRDEPLVRRALQRRIRVLLIDEFQDVDPVQKEIAYLLGEPERRDADTTRLVLVGDPKQSIYRFRHADVASWNDVQRDFDSGVGRVVALEENYRSVPGILAMVDATVGRSLDTPLVGESLRPFEVPYLPVLAARAPEDAHAVEFLLVPPAANGKNRKAEEARDIEADAIAARARALHDDGVAWNEMALLFATWYSVQKYEDALRRAGVPFYTLRGEGFLETREVQDLVLALETIRDPSDERALLGFLRSPFIGLRDDTLLRIAREAEYPWWRHLDEIEPVDERTRGLGELLGSVEFEETEAERLGRAAALLRRMVQLRDRVPVTELLADLLRESGYLGHLALLGEKGRQAIANVRQFIDMARAMNEVGAGDLLRAVRERRARGDRIAEARLYAEADDVVTITSIHVAKGLEWRVVFWCDLAHGPRPSADKLLISRDELRLGRPDSKPDEQDLDWQLLRGLLEKEAEAEQKRLWYVAATRARDRLILSGIPQGSNDPYRTSFAYVLGDTFRELDSAVSGDSVTYCDHLGRSYAAPVRVADPVGTRDPREVLVPLPEDAPAVEEIEEVEPITDPWTLELPPEPIRTPVGPARHSATEFLTYSRCTRRHWYKYVAGVREPELTSSQKDELISAVRRGQIVHDVLERYQEEQELDAVLEEAIGRFDQDAPPPDSERGRRYRAHLKDELTGVLTHPEYTQVAERPGARRELGFVYIGPRGTVAQGSIDLAAPAGAGLELLDVKTTQCDAAAAAVKAAQYAPQRDVYATAASAIAGRPVERFGFQFSHAGVQVSTALDGRALEEAARRVEETAAEIGRGVPALTRFPEECRFCGYRNVSLCSGAAQASASDPLEQRLERLRANRFRARFRLRGAELDYVRERGLREVMAQARKLIVKRLAPAQPPNDGRQTPWRGHPLFIAQHATATCCRSCLETWHHISRNTALSQDTITYVLNVLERWLRRELGDENREGQPEQLRLF